MVYVFDILPQQGTISPMTALIHSYAIVEDTDPTRRGTTIGISAHIGGITIGASHDGFSAFLVNATTTTDTRYFLQSGQKYFSDGSRKHVWTDTTHGLSEHDFNLTYTTGAEYEYDITYMGSPGVWWIGAENYSTGLSDFFIEYYGQGSNLVTDTGTGVFFENANTSPTWYYGFPYYISAFHARDMNSSWQWVNWSYQNIVIQRGANYYSNNIISGSLVGNSSALWYLPNMLLGQ